VRARFLLACGCLAEGSCVAALSFQDNPREVCCSRFSPEKMQERGCFFTGIAKHPEKDSAATQSRI
jgi:hypothetical protein